jgi:hypothetical protein
MRRTWVGLVCYGAMGAVILAGWGVCIAVLVGWISGCSASPPIVQPPTPPIVDAGSDGAPPPNKDWDPECVAACARARALKCSFAEETPRYHEACESWCTRVSAVILSQLQCIQKVTACDQIPNCPR